MPVSSLKRDVPEGFDSPIALPSTPEQETQWQEANRSWWENHPMRYDFSEEIGCKEFSKEFYEEINRRFFADAQTFLPWKKIPFDALIDFDSLRDKDVLEIGVGNGSHAQLLSSAAQSYTGIDLTDYAVRSTTERLRCFGLNKPTTRIIRMDAERMEFADNSFDFIWSWGVIHHSANTKKILQEMHRVLKPGGQAITMVYHRNLWGYYFVAGLLSGVLNGHLLKTGSIHKAQQKVTDGAIARYYTISEWRALVSEFFQIDTIQIFGSKTDIVPLPAGRLKGALLRAIPDNVGRLLTNRAKMGTFLVSKFRKA